MSLCCSFMSIFPATSSRRRLSFSRISCMDCTRFRSGLSAALTLSFSVDAVFRTAVVVMAVAGSDDEEDGERALAFRVVTVDEGGENCEFESMSELVQGTELGAFSFACTELGCGGDMGPSCDWCCC